MKSWQMGIGARPTQWKLPGLRPAFGGDKRSSSLPTYPGWVA